MLLTGLAWLNTLLLVVSLGIRAYALIDALLRPDQAFVAAGKLTKPAWLVILALAFVIGLVGLDSLVGIFNIAGLIAAIVYLVDVRPAVRALTPRKPRPESW